MCAGTLLVYMYMHHMHAWCLWETEEGVRSPETGATDDCQLQMSGLRTKPGILGRAARTLNH